MKTTMVDVTFAVFKIKKLQINFILFYFFINNKSLSVCKNEFSIQTL